MTPADLPQVARVAERVHPDYPEDLAIFTERQRLYPPGCLVLEHDGVRGYAFAHPWRFGHPPKLNTKLHRLPDDADTFYLHDIAILPEARGAGAGQAVVPLLRAQAAAARLGSLSLIAVGQSRPFWIKHGFSVHVSDTLRAALSSYGAEACFMVHR